MQKIDNFLNCLNVLESTKRSDADGWEIVRMGIIWTVQFDV